MSRTIHLCQWTYFRLIQAVQHIYSSMKSAVRLVCFHTRSYNKCFQVVYRTKSTRSHSSHETFTLRILSHLLRFHGLKGHKAGFRTVRGHFKLLSPFSAWNLSTGLTVRVSSPSRVGRYSLHQNLPDRLWGPPSFLFNRYQGPKRKINHLPPFSTHMSSWP
jgi:hypothetical protein